MTARDKARYNKKSIRCYMVAGPNFGRFCAGQTIKELVDSLTQMEDVKAMTKSQRIEITIQSFTPHEFENMTEI